MGWVGAIWLELKAFWRWFWFGHAGSRTPWVRRVFAVLFFFLVPAPVFLLLVFRFLPIPGTPQMLIDLVIACSFGIGWMRADARRRGIGTTWPFVPAVVAVGSIGLLAYVVWRAFAARPNSLEPVHR